MTDPNQRLSTLRRNLARAQSTAERKRALAEIERIIKDKLECELVERLQRATPKDNADARAELRAAGLDTKKMAQLIRANPAHLANMIELAAGDGPAERDAEGFPVGMTDALKADLRAAGLDPSKLPRPEEASPEVQASVASYKIAEDASIGADGFPSDMPEILKGVLREAGLDPHKLAQLAKENIERGGVMRRPPRMTGGPGADGFPKDMPEDVKAIMRSAGVNPHRLNALVAAKLLEDAPDDNDRMKTIKALLKRGLDARPDVANDPRMGLEEFVQAARDAKARFNDTGESGFPPDMDAETRAELERLGVAGVTTTAVKIPPDLSAQFDACFKEMGEAGDGRAGVVDVAAIAQASSHPDACTCAPCRLRRLVLEASAREGGLSTFVPASSAPLH